METPGAQAVAEKAMSEQQILDELASFFDVEEKQPSEDEPVEPTAERAEEATDDGAEPEEEETDAEVTEDEREEEADESAEERWIPQNLEELAEALEVSPEELENTLRIRRKVDGEEDEVTLASLKKTSQIESALNKRLEAVAHERKAYEAAQKETAEKRSEMDAMLKATEQLLVADYQGVDWDELKKYDKEEYLIKERELTQRYQALLALKEQVKAKDEETAKKEQAQRQEAYDKHMRQEAENLMARLPEWKDRKVYEREIGDVVNYLKSEMNYGDDDVQKFTDHRAWVLAKKAMLFDQMATTANPKAKKLKSKPKLIPPGKRRAKAGASNNAAKEAFARAQKLQTNDAWADALAAKLFTSDGD